MHTIVVDAEALFIHFNSRFSSTGFKCFRIYFESVNAYEHRMKRNGQTFIVEKHDLAGLNYLWQIILETPYDDIAEDAAHYVIQLSYALLSPKLKRVRHGLYL